MSSKKPTLDEVFAEIGFPDPPLLLNHHAKPKRHQTVNNFPVKDCGKQTYPSERVARAAIHNRKNKGTGGAVNLIPYHCDKCGGWHMTSREGGAPYR